MLVTLQYVSCFMFDFQSDRLMWCFWNLEIEVLLIFHLCYNNRTSPFQTLSDLHCIDSDCTFDSVDSLIVSIITYVEVLSSVSEMTRSTTKNGSKTANMSLFWTLEHVFRPLQHLLPICQKGKRSKRTLI